MVLTLSACASANKDLPAPLKVEIPPTCEQVLAEVPFPPAKPEDDARVAFMRGDAALITANGRIRAGRNCIADVRRRYAGEKE